MKEIINKLKFLGLTKIEAKIYLVLLKLGMSKAGQISKEIQINRTTTYDSLRRLLDKGLVSYVVQANTKVYEATNPEIILELVKEKEKEAKSIIPQLKEIYKRPKRKKDVTLYYGYKGVKSVFQDILREGKEILVLDDEGGFSSKMPYYAPHYIREIEKKKIPIKHIVREGVKINSTKTTKVRHISKKTKSFSAMDIYGDKVAIIIWTEPPEAVIIKNKTAADSFRSYFEELWKNSKP